MYKKLTAIAACILLLVSSPSVQAAVTETPIEIKEVKPVSYNENSIFPIICDKKLYGIATINWVQKVGVSDWSIAEAAKNNVNHSYAVNLKITAFKTSSFSCKPTLESAKGKRLGTLAECGWSGFDTSALIQKGKSHSIEVCIQPFKKTLTKGSKLVLQFQCDAGKSRPIKISIAKWDKKKAIGALVKKGSYTVKSINGGQFKLKPVSVCIEDQKLGDSADKFKTVAMYWYDVQFSKKPKTSRGVSFFKSGKLNPNFVSWVYTQNSNEPLTQVCSNAKCLLYKDSENYYLYLQRSDNLKLHQSTCVLTNKIVGASQKSVEKVRIAFAFPEEAATRSVKEMKSFNGRYLVFEVSVTGRDLIERN